MKEIRGVMKQAQELSRDKRIISLSGCVKHTSSSDSYAKILDELTDLKVNVGKKICHTPGCEGVLHMNNINKCWKCNKRQLSVITESSCHEKCFEELPESVSTIRYAADKLMNPKNSAEIDDDKVSPGLPIFYAPTTMENCSKIMHELCIRF